MDRHYHVDFTPSAVAEAHRKDLEIQDEHGVNFMTYWFDEERNTIFCLVDAPDVDSVRNAHNDAHGGAINEIIEVDENLVQAFLGRVTDPSVIPEEEIEVDSAFRAIMFTDLKDSTLMASQYGDQVALELLRNHNEITRNAVVAHDGREVKHTGDGFMLSFVSASDAVECAIQIQQDFASYNNESPEVPLHLRIGLSAGEPVRDDEQLFGLAVNLAARLCASAEPDNILVAQVVRDLCLGKGIPFDDLGETIPKGFEQPVRIFEVLWKKR
jgi:class 3 adenylate cyclase